MSKFIQRRDMRISSCTRNSFKRNLSNIYKFIIIIIASFLIIHLLIQNSSLFFRKSVTLPFSLHLSKNDLVLIKGEEYKLHTYRLNKRVTYHSTNFRVAGVNFNGRIFAYRTGKAFIIAEVGGRKLKCRVRVIDINKEKLVLKEGEGYRLKIHGKAIFTNVRYQSSNKSVAVVSSGGRVKAVGKGKAVITAVYKGKKLKCSVTVR